MGIVIGSVLNKWYWCILTLDLSVQVKVRSSAYRFIVLQFETLMTHYQLNLQIKHSVNGVDIASCNQTVCNFDQEQSGQHVKAANHSSFCFEKTFSNRHKYTNQSTGIDQK